MIATAIGSISGLVSGGYDGLFLGASTEAGGGRGAWAVALMVAQWRRERRLNRYFSQDGPVAQHVRQNQRS
ncbi:MAG: hypothetical protein R2838_18315 [Caldilineaceae bacterium]